MLIRINFIMNSFSEHGVIGTIVILTFILMLFLTNKDKVMDKENGVNFLYSKFILLFHYFQ